uniref:hypothetical protein n=1 Tax=Streptomyces sp. ODS05-4 TaxID=2944939 RepID=UPI00210BFC13
MAIRALKAQGGGSPFTAAVRRAATVRRTAAVRCTAAAALTGALLLWPATPLPASASASASASLTSPSASVPTPPGTLADGGPVTQCAHAGTAHGRLGQYAEVTLCVTAGGGSMTVTAAADCRATAPGARARVCRTSGVWALHREPGGGPAVTPIPVPADEPPVTGALAGRADYPGPGVYRVEADVRITTETPPGTDTPATPTEPDSAAAPTSRTEPTSATEPDSAATAPESRTEALRGRAQATFTLTESKPLPAYRVEVSRPADQPATLVPDTATTLTYTVSATGEHGDGSARLGLIGEAGSGMEVSSADARCVNPLPGRYPSTTRTRHALDCTLTDIQPGRPATVTVSATLRSLCSTLVAKLGHWTPRGQSPTGGMFDGPT